MGKMSNEEMLYRIMVSVGEIQSDISQLKTDVAELKTDMAELKVRVAVLENDVAELKADVAELKVRVTVLETDVAELKTDVAELKTGVATLNTRVTDIGITLEQNILLRLDTLQELHREDNELLRKAVYRVDDMEMKLDCVIVYINRDARRRKSRSFNEKSM